MRLPITVDAKLSGMQGLREELATKGSTTFVWRGRSLVEIITDGN